MISDPVFYLAAIPAILLTGVSKGGFGSGLGLLATPLIALTVPTPQAAAIMLPLLCAMDVIGLWAYRGRWSAENLRIILPGGLLGVVLGTLTFRYFSESLLRGLLGVMALSFVVHWFFTGRGAGSATPPSPIKGWFWSGVSGVTSTIAHAGGPPLDVYLLPLKLERREFVATTVLFFAVINATKVFPYIWLGLFDGRNLSTSLALLPLVPVGMGLGIWMVSRIGQVLFYRTCYALLFFVGVKLLYDGYAEFSYLSR